MYTDILIKSKKGIPSPCDYQHIKYWGYDNKSPKYKIPFKPRKTLFDEINHDAKRCPSPGVG